MQNVKTETALDAKRYSVQTQRVRADYQQKGSTARDLSSGREKGDEENRQILVYQARGRIEKSALLYNQFKQEGEGI